MQQSNLENNYNILGIPETENIINWMINIVELVIYRSKLNNWILTLATVKAYLEYTMVIKKHIAYTNAYISGQQLLDHNPRKNIL